MRKFIKAKDEFFWWKRLSSGSLMIIGRAIVLYIGSGNKWEEVYSIDSFPIFDIEAEKANVIKFYQSENETKYIDWCRAKGVVERGQRIKACYCGNVLNYSKNHVVGDVNENVEIHLCSECDTIVPLYINASGRIKTTTTNMTRERFMTKLKERNNE